MQDPELPFLIDRGDRRDGTISARAPHLRGHGHGTPSFGAGLSCPESVSKCENRGDGEGLSRPVGVAWSAGWFAVGAGLAIANHARHRLLGYGRPRAFGPGDLERTVEHVVGVVDRWRRSGLKPRDRRILEVGPGPDLGTGFALIAIGAASYTAVDRYPLVRENTALYAALGDRLGADVAATRRRMPYVVGTMPITGVSPGFDAFVSNAALEHVPDVAGTLAWLQSLAAPGAIHVHLVDAQTHMRWVRPRDPWNILRYPDWLYRLMAFPGAPNRLLASDYLAEAQRVGLGFSVLTEKRADVEYVRSIQPFLAAPFRHRLEPDLSSLTFTLVGGAVAAEDVRA